MNVYALNWPVIPYEKLVAGKYDLYVDCKQIHNTKNKKIFVQLEPPEVGRCRDWLVEHEHEFDKILAWDEWILDRFSKASFLPYHTWGWLCKDQYSVTYDKQFEITFGRWLKRFTAGHEIRYELYNKKEKIKVPFKSFTVLERYTERFNKLFKHSQFHVAIENTRHNNFFTEKVIDAFLSKTIPIYYGCLNIDRYFDINGIYVAADCNDIINICNSLTPDTYAEKIKYVNRNFEIAKNFHESDWYAKLNAGIQA